MFVSCVWFIIISVLLCFEPTDSLPRTSRSGLRRQTYECGRVPPSASPLVLGGKRARHGELPWHVGVYKRRSRPYRQVCGGSIVSDTLVVSAAHCFWDPFLNQRRPAVDYAVGTGKIYRPWHEPHDEHAQLFTVIEILIPDVFRGEDRNYADDIALLVLDRPLQFRPYLRPVCLDFNHTLEAEQLRNGALGKVGGWGVTSHNGSESGVLLTVQLPFMDLDTCLRTTPPSYWEVLTNDKFCAGFDNGTTLCQGDSGGGLVFPQTDARGVTRYQLRGIASSSPTGTGSCNAQAVTTFTRVSRYAAFIAQRTELRLDDRTTNPRMCELPAYPQDGGYIVEDEPFAKPGDVFESVVLNVTCDAEHWLSGDPGVFCVRGRWQGPLPLCLGCGLAGPVASPLVYGGRGAVKGELPWHVGVYKRGYGGQAPGLVCGGTIVSPGVVISAAHCFWNQAANSQLPAEHFLVMGGTTSSLWSRNNQDHHAQFSAVSEIAIPPTYRRSSNAYRGDLAVLVLAAPFRLRPYLRPVCLDLLAGPTDGAEGKTGGWGATTQDLDNQKRPPSLQTAFQSFRNKSSCSVPESVFPDDMFCAGSKVSTLLDGDSGGGLAFPRPSRAGAEAEAKRYVLRGVTAAGPPVVDDHAGAFKPTLFTDIAKHRAFIERYLRAAE